MTKKHLAYVAILGIVAVALLLTRGTTQQVSLYHWPPGTVLPTSCFLGDYYIKTDAPIGQQVYIATAGLDNYRVIFCKKD